MRGIGNLGRRLAVALAALSLVAACAEGDLGGLSLGGQPEVTEEDLTPAQIRMRERASAFNKTIWEGVAAGAGAGALAGGLFSDDWLKGAIIGATVGAIVGGAAGAYVAKKQEQYADREEVLDAMTADVQQKNLEAQNLIETMREVVAEDNLKLVALNEQYQQKLISDADYRRELAVVQSDRELIDQAIDKAGKQHDTFSEAKEIYEEQNPDVTTTQLAMEIDTLQDRITTMNAIVADLSAPELG